MWVRNEVWPTRLPREGELLNQSRIKGPDVGKQKQGKGSTKHCARKSDSSIPRARMPQVSPHGSLAELRLQLQERFSSTTMSCRSPCLCSKRILPKALVPSNTVKSVGARPFSFSKAFWAPLQVGRRPRRVGYSSAAIMILGNSRFLPKPFMSRTTSLFGCWPINLRRSPRRLRADEHSRKGTEARIEPPPERSS
jgi:hypothetical protein